MNRLRLDDRPIWTEGPSPIPIRTPQWVSGGGLAVRVDPRRGPTDLRGSGGGTPIRVELPGEDPETGILPGGWIRKVDDTVEEGLLAGGALVLRWNTEVHLDGIPHPPGTLALHLGEDEDRLRKFLKPIAARALQRVGPAGIQVRWGDLPGLEDAAVLLDVDGPIPDLERPSTRAEHGIALLLLGRHEAAWRTLESLAGEATPGFLHLAALWGGWTGAPGRLLALEAPLREAIRSLDTHAATWPEPARLVHDLARILEPVADEWPKALLVRSALLEGREGGRIPPLTAFFGAKDLHTAARLVRSWIAGQLGADAEMAYGRLTLAPILGQRGLDTPAPPDAPLEVRKLRAGDALIDLHCRREPGRFTFRLVQQSGRLPVNVIFDPWLPVREVRQVRMGEDIVDVDLREEDGGTRVRLQFPLDPERRLTVDE